MEAARSPLKRIAFDRGIGGGGQDAHALRVSRWARADRHAAHGLRTGAAWRRRLFSPIAHPKRTPAEPVEDLAARTALMAHAKAIWPSVKSGLTNQERWWEGALTSAEASSAVMGTPVVEWSWAGGIPQEASPWLGLVPEYADRKNYVIPVLAAGRPVALMGADNQSGRWSIYPLYVRPAADFATALDRIAEVLGTRHFEYCLLDEGTWVLARAGGRVVGVMAFPVTDHRKGKPPTGVLQGSGLRWWLDHPLGT